MTIHRTCVLIALLLGMTACSNLTRREKEDAATEGYAVNKSWAHSARSVISPDTPRDTDDDGEYEGGIAEAAHGPKDDRDTSKLTSLDGEDPEELGDVIVDLEEGVWTVDDYVRLDDATGIVIRGKGPNKTRLELDSESIKAIVMVGARRIVIRDLTIAAHTGGGIWIKDCKDVVVKNVHFAAARYALHLSDSTATVTSSIFAGCQTGIRLRDDATLKLRDSAFVDCWTAMKLTDSGADIESCAFLDGREVIKGSLDRRTRFVGNLVYGKKQKLAWTGRPDIAAHNLTHFRSLKVKLGTETNRELRSIDDFPRAARLPSPFDVVGVHLALLRNEKRGKKDYEQLLTDACREEAQSFAEASQKAVQAGDIKNARYLARIAVRYWGDRPIKDAPEELIEIAELAK